nr:hypothetical protein [Tanacetum cinerariifolium]
MAFKNLAYAEDEEDLYFLPKEPSPGFSTGSPSASRIGKSDDDEGKLLSFQLFSIGFVASEVYPLLALFRSLCSVVDNAKNRRPRELVEIIEKLRGECNVIKEREGAQEEESESLRV